MNGKKILASVRLQNNSCLGMKKVLAWLSQKTIADFFSDNSSNQQMKGYFMIFLG